MRDLIARGTLAGGARLDEVALSDRIGVSRTPLREALIALEGEGLVQSTPNKGFTVVLANEALVREVFPILAALESVAVRLSGEAVVKAAPELAALNQELLSARSKPKQYELDSAFHRRLTASCGNARLLKLLAVHRDMARRFDGAHGRGTADQAGSCREHAEIVAVIEKGRLDKAADLLIAHWRRGEDVVIAWLKERP